jgi:hypothetical protein
VNTYEFVSSLTKKQCRYLLRYAGFYCEHNENRGELRFAVERNLKAGTIAPNMAENIFGKIKRKGRKHERLHRDI